MYPQTLYSGPSLAAQFALPGHILETVTVHSEIFGQKSFLNDVENYTRLIDITVRIWQPPYSAKFSQISNFAIFANFNS